MGWQNDQRSMMGMEAIVAFEALLMLSLCLLIGIFLVIGGRVIGNTVLLVIRISRRQMPTARLAPVVVASVFMLGIVLICWAAWQGLATYTRNKFAALDATTDEGAFPPDSPSASGSSTSLVPWGSLGRWGRNFVSSATAIEELERFHGPGADLSEPVRVYVGLGGASSVSRRAELAVRELDRAGGFDRGTLAVWVPTGTGWMVPEAAKALEQLHRGDTAIVGIQYSFLPSLISVFIDRGAAIETASALFDAVHLHWSSLPPEKRPQLVLFSKSLGTAGLEARFAGVDASTSITHLTALTDGVLFVGAKHTNPIHSQITRERDPGSPVWQPVFDGGRSLRFLNRDTYQPDRAEDCMPRIAYLQHPSDPVPLWGIEALWRPPKWMGQPRGFDVPDAVLWFPIVTGVHAAVDLIFQLSTPPGFGHVYSADYVQGWAAVIPPPGWTNADTRRLEKFLDSKSLGESEL